MTTIPGRSFAGLVVAHLALTVVVCGGFVLLLPTPAASHDFRATVAPVLDCSASANPSSDHQFTRPDAELSAPDCDDDDDDDDDAPTGSDAAIAVDQWRTITRGDVMDVVRIEAEPWISRTVDGHSLRGPPADDQRSSDADDDFDGDDDDPSAESSDLLPSASSQATCFLTPAEFLSASSTRSSSLSLRAPPL